jgi:hypothetical protein
MSRLIPYGTAGNNINVLSGGVPNYIDDGFSLYAIDNGGVKISVKATGSKGSTTLTLSGTPASLNVKVGQYVSGVNILPVDSSTVPTKVTSILVSGNANGITISSPLANDIDGGYVNFYTNPFSVEYQIESMAASGVESLRFSLPWDTIEKVQPSGTNHTYSWTTAGSNSKYNLDAFIYMASKNGIMLMPRLSGIPSWEIDYDYKLDLSNPFSTRDPAESSSYLPYQGVRVTASGYTGSRTVIVEDINRAFMIQVGMALSGTGFQSGTKVTGVTKGTNTYTITFDKSLTANVGNYAAPTQSLNMTAGINQFYENNYQGLTTNKKLYKNTGTPGAPGQISDQFVFETLNDFNIFLIHVKRKGGTIPKNYDNFVTFANAVLNRYGNNGNFWNNSIWGGNYSLSRTASWVTSDATNVITVNDAANIVVGMTVEEVTTQTNQNLFNIPPNTRVSSINGKNITLSNVITTTYSGTPISIKLKYPKIINWQIYNEFNLQNNSNAIFAYIKDIDRNFCFIANDMATNWPQHRRNETIINGVTRIGQAANATMYTSGGQVCYRFTGLTNLASYFTSYNAKTEISIGENDNASGFSGAYKIKSISSTELTVMHRDGSSDLPSLSTVSGRTFDICRITTKTKTLLDKGYTWAPSIIELVEKIKLEAHSIDSKTKIVLGAMAEGTDASYITPIYANAESIAKDSPYQAVFEPKFGNGKNKFDKFSGNTYRTSNKTNGVRTDPSDSYRMVANITRSLLPDIIESNYFKLVNASGATIPEVQDFPNYIISEHGSPADSSETRQNEYVGPFVQATPIYDSVNKKYSKGYVELVTDKYKYSYTKNWTIDQVMYYKWATDYTNGLDPGVENARGLIYYYNSKSKTSNTDIKSGTLTSSGNVLTFSAGIPSTWTVNSNIFANGTIPNFPSKGAIITAKSSNTITISVTPSNPISVTLNATNYVSCLYNFNPRQSDVIYGSGGFGYATGLLALEGRT